MHARTRRRLAERLDRLEETIERRPDWEYLMASMRLWAASGVVGEEFNSAFAEYDRLRAGIEARGDLPPENYWVPPAEGGDRLRRWWELDHPDLRDSTVRMLRLFLDYRQRVKSQPRAQDPGGGPDALPAEHRTAPSPAPPPHQ